MFEFDATKINKLKIHQKIADFFKKMNTNSEIKLTLQIIIIYNQ